MAYPLNENYLSRYLLSLDKTNNFSRMEIVRTILANYKGKPFSASEIGVYGISCAMLRAYGVLEIVDCETIQWERINRRGRKVIEEYDRYRYDLAMPIEELKTALNRILNSAITTIKEF